MHFELEIGTLRLQASLGSADEVSETERLLDEATTAMRDLREMVEDLTARLATSEEKRKAAVEDIVRLQHDLTGHKDKLREVHTEHVKALAQADEAKFKTNEALQRLLHFADYPEVEQFSRLMVKKLKQHEEERGGKSWKDDETKALVQRLAVLSAKCTGSPPSDYSGGGDPSVTAWRAVNVANLAMMVVDSFDVMGDLEGEELEEAT